jgi:hypothetical protein
MIVMVQQEIRSPQVLSYRLVEDERYLVAVVLLRPLFGRAARESALKEIADELSKQSDKEVWVTADLDLWAKADFAPAAELVALLQQR